MAGGRTPGSLSFSYTGYDLITRGKKTKEQKMKESPSDFEIPPALKCLRNIQQAIKHLRNIPESKPEG